MPVVFAAGDLWGVAVTRVAALSLRAGPAPTTVFSYVTAKIASPRATAVVGWGIVMMAVVGHRTQRRGAVEVRVYRPLRLFLQ